MIYAACAVHVTIIGTGSEFRPVSNFTELHTLTLAARFYALLPDAIDSSSTNDRLASPQRNFSKVAHQN